uniref:Predicted protein n=1 Tax=Physcomitrium patens TaxID=3218 RepID=A9U601_PHYPA
MRPELVGRLNVVLITGLRFRFRLFHPLCCSGNVLSVKGSLKGKNGGESSDDESQFWIQALTAGANFGFKTKDCRNSELSRLYSNSQKLIDCLTIGESPYYLLQPDARHNLQATELLREFERQYSQLSKVEKLTLEPNKVDLFLQAADGELQGKLELLLEDKEEDEGLTTKWKNVEDAMGLLTKRKRRKDRSNIPKTVQAPKAPIRITPPTMPTVQPSTSLSKKADMEMEEIIREMRDLQIKLARLEENTSTNNSKNISKQGYVERCIWCDDTSHTRKDCNEFNNMIRQGIIC